MSTDPADGPSARSESPVATETLRSVHTANLPALFDELNISLVVSTYQAGKVIMVRRDGEVLNTHFRTFAKPMGIAADRARLTIGGTNTVWYYRNVPAVAPKLEPLGKHDAWRGHLGGASRRSLGKTGVAGRVEFADPASYH